MRHEQQHAKAARQGGTEGSFAWIIPDDGPITVHGPGGDRVRVTHPIGKNESHSSWSGFHFEWERKGTWS